MMKQSETTRDEHHASVDVGRRNLLKLAGTGVAGLGVMSAIETPVFAQARSRGIRPFRRAIASITGRSPLTTGSASPSWRTSMSRRPSIVRERHPALVVGGPYGAVKEQSSGLYAQTMAERGYITLAHDPSYVGESGGQPHDTASAEALVEDFSAGVDFLGRLPFVDRERIGVLGVCGSGGFGLAAAEIDPRIKAVATVSMYDIGQAKRQGLAPHVDEGALRKNLNEVAAQRWAEVDGAERTMVIGTPQVLTARSTAIDREFYDYYRTPAASTRARRRRSRASSDAQMTLFWSYQHLDWISPRPVLFITGDRAHSRIFSEHAYSRASEPKELFIVPGAGHVDLYDRVSLIPWDKLQSFFGTHLAGAKGRS